MRVWVTLFAFLGVFLGLAGFAQAGEATFALVPFEAGTSVEEWRALNSAFEVGFMEAGKIRIVPMAVVMGEAERLGTVEATGESGLPEDFFPSARKDEVPKFVLNMANLKQLAEALGVRYVVFGRLTVQVARDGSLNPLRVGLISAPAKFVSRLLYGPGTGIPALAGEVTVGGLAGYLLGSEANDPFEPPRKKTYHVGHPLSGRTVTRLVGGDEDHDILNGLFFGAIGGGLVFLAHENGPAVVEATALVSTYDVNAGRVVESYTVTERATVRNVFDAKDGRTLVFEAVKRVGRSAGEALAGALVGKDQGTSGLLRSL